jgi:predicted RNA-binding Zn ribbon-like protein
MIEDVDVPPAAQLLRDFVNTYEPQVDAESLASTADLGRWLAGRHLLAGDAPLTSADLATVIAVREGLRAVLLDHAGHAREPADEAAVQVLNQTLGELPLRLTFTEQGYGLSGASPTPVVHVVGQLAEAVRQSTEEGSWPRLKVCARDTCRWAFYDASRNQVRRWCSMAGCGNHIKMKRAYAARKSRDRPAADPTVS